VNLLEIGLLSLSFIFYIGKYLNYYNLKVVIILEVLCWMDGGDGRRVGLGEMGWDGEMAMVIGIFNGG
jgi:hypothetical protein